LCRSLYYASCCPWSASHVSFSVLIPVSLYQIAGEFTTMAGRRMRATVQKVLASYDPYYDDATVVIAGLSNAYSGYTTTHEEYGTRKSMQLPFGINI